MATKQTIPLPMGTLEWFVAMHPCLPCHRDRALHLAGEGVTVIRLQKSSDSEMFPHFNSSAWALRPSPFR